jgi:hypothetical protein
VRLVSFSADDKTRSGVLDGALVIEPDATLRGDLLRRHGEAAHDRIEPVATDMAAFFESGPRGRHRAEEAVAVAVENIAAGDEIRTINGRATVHPLGAVRLLAPVPRPRRIRDYLTYSQHTSESGLISRSGLGQTVAPSHAGTA